MSTEHENIRELLHAYVDGELDLANTRETERHLQSCADCRGTEKAIRELRSTLTSDAPAYRAPAHLRKRVRAALRREAKSTRQTLSPWLMFATGAAFAAVLVGALLFQTMHQARTIRLLTRWSRIMCAHFSPRSLSMSCRRISTLSNRGSTVKSISLRKCATYPLMVFLSSADDSIIWMAKRSPRLFTNETSTRSICSSRRNQRSKHFANRDNPTRIQCLFLGQ